MNKTRIAVIGAAGRMGQASVRAILARADADLCGALVRRGSALTGTPLTSVFGELAPPGEFSESLPLSANPNVLLEFSTVDAFDEALALALSRGLPLVSGTTGLSAVQTESLKLAAQRIPVLWASNFSLGIALLRKLVTIASKSLGDEYDVEIAETHHRDKRDAPSGTALTLGKAIAQAREVSFNEVARFARHGVGGPRQPGEIGFAVTRAADVVGDHTVLFASAGERIELKHSATSRELFAQGAVRAALWLAQKPPGLYDIVDVVS